jgi:hypothetical protein
MLIYCRRFLLPGLFVFLPPLQAFAQQAASEVAVPLVMFPGTLLRLKVDGTSIPKHVGELVHARLAQPVYAFDNELLPEGASVTGRIVGFDEVSRMHRFESMLGGHFGSFKRPEVEFDTISTAGEASRRIITDTIPSNGEFAEMRVSGGRKRGVIRSAASRAKQEIQTRIDRARNFVRSRHKTRVLRDAALDLLPYRPAMIADGSTFDAVLITPENFGTEQVPADKLLKLGQNTPGEIGRAHV